MFRRGNGYRECRTRTEKYEYVVLLGDIVHNSLEVERLEKLGLRTIGHDEFTRLKGEKVLLRAHGEPPSTYEIAPAISWNFFQGTKLAQVTRLAKAQLDESIRQFNQDVLTAVQEVDNAMNSYKNSIKQIVALREVVNQGKQTLELSLDLYKQGLTPFQNVLDAQRSLLSYENELTQARGSSLLSLIQLYQALGGKIGKMKIDN